MASPQKLFSNNYYFLQLTHTIPTNYMLKMLLKANAFFPCNRFEIKINISRKVAKNFTKFWGDCLFWPLFIKKKVYSNKKTNVTGIVLVYTKYSIKQVVQLLYTSDTIPKF